MAGPGAVSSVPPHGWDIYVQKLISRYHLGLIFTNLPKLLCLPSFPLHPPLSEGMWAPSEATAPGFSVPLISMTQFSWLLSVITWYRETYFQNMKLEHPRVKCLSVLPSKESHSGKWEFRRTSEELWSRFPACFTPKPFLTLTSRLKVNSEQTVSSVCRAFPTEWSTDVIL